MKNTCIKEKEELEEFCDYIREQINSGEFESAEVKIQFIMSKYPHSSIPHNLMGVLMKKENNHVLAMKHFRAAYALDPTYLPAQHNLESCSSLFIFNTLAYDYKDCQVN